MDELSGRLRDAADAVDVPNEDLSDVVRRGRRTRRRRIALGSAMTILLIAAAGSAWSLVGGWDPSEPAPPASGGHDLVAALLEEPFDESLPADLVAEPTEETDMSGPGELGTVIVRFSTDRLPSEGAGGPAHIYYTVFEDAASAVRRHNKADESFRDQARDSAAARVFDIEGLEAPHFCSEWEGVDASCYVVVDDVRIGVTSRLKMMGAAATSRVEDITLAAVRHLNDVRGTEMDLPAPAWEPPERFMPPVEIRGETAVLPVTFLDGTSVTLRAHRSLKIQKMYGQPYTSGGIARIDRTIEFFYGESEHDLHQGPMETYPGSDGSKVEVWEPRPLEGEEDCPNLIYRYRSWGAAVRTCQDELTDEEKEIWARSLAGEVTDDGYLILSSVGEVTLEGPSMNLWMDRSGNYIRLKPGSCTVSRRGGEQHRAADGTMVTLNEAQDGTFAANWCLDEDLHVQVVGPRDFVVTAAETLRAEGLRPGPGS